MKIRKRIFYILGMKKMSNSKKGLLEGKMERNIRYIFPKDYCKNNA